MKNEKIKKILIGAGIFIIVVLLLDNVIMPFIVSSDEISVPNVVNKHKEEAIRLLEAANLNPVLETNQYDPKVLKDFVILQRPEAGSVVKKGRRVHLAISGGDEKAIMPNLTGKTVKEAELLLQNAGLKLGMTEQEESEEPQNVVISQQFPSDININKGTAVNVKISIGPAPGMLRAPELIGKSLKDAQTVLESMGLTMGKVDYRFSPNLLPNTVIEQTPSVDTLLKTGSAIDLVVASSKK